MLERLKQEVCRANRLLVRYRLVTLTWGNASGIDREQGLVVIKPSGLDYARLEPDHMTVVELTSGRWVEGSYAPSSDTPTHLAIYRRFPQIGGIVHTHSPWATMWAQAGRGIPAYGTTHGDTFCGGVPCTRPMTTAEIRGDYEANTGKVILECFQSVSPDEVPAVLVYEHGPFTWGPRPLTAVENAVVLEEIARMAYFTEQIGGKDRGSMQPELLEKHFRRKHGASAYYGQPSGHSRVSTTDR